MPNQNAQVEFNRYAEVQDNMQEIRQAHQSAVADGEPRSPALTLGTTTRVEAISTSRTLAKQIATIRTLIDKMSSAVAVRST